MEKLTLKKYLEKLSLQEKTKGPTLQAMEWLMESLGNPQNQVKCIHVAGTNGKGSLCEMLSNILMQAGYRVGKYMSPHLLCVNERICINNEPISDEKSAYYLEKLDKNIQRYNQTHEKQVTYFEVVTALAFLYFAEEKCDVMVIETGLGGLLDSTNVTKESISLFSTIGYDHMAILGNTLEEIARQKAGIIKSQGHTIFVEQTEEQVNKVIEETCKQKENTLKMIKKEEIQSIKITDELQLFDYQDYKQILVNLKGEKQLSNAAMCIEACHILHTQGFLISKQAMYTGLSQVVHKARFEKLASNPTIIFDGAHNENAIFNLKKTIQMYYPKQKKVFILSILKTKDYQAILQSLMQEENSAIYFFTDGINKNRFVAKEELYRVAKNYHRDNLYIASLEEAITTARNRFEKEVIYIIGSFYVYPEVLEILKIETIEKGKEKNAKT